MIQKLKNRIEESVGMSSVMWKDIVSNVYTLEVKKNEILVEQGTNSKYVYFIAKGGFISSFIAENGNKRASWFYLSDDFDFVSNNDSFFKNVPTSYEIKAVEDSTVVVFKKDDVHKWVEIYPLFNSFYRKVLISRFLTIEKVRGVFLTNSVEEFVIYLKENHPLFFLRVKDYYLAQFIGISPEWFSKLKKKLNYLV